MGEMCWTSTLNPLDTKSDHLWIVTSCEVQKMMVLTSWRYVIKTLIYGNFTYISHGHCTLNEYGSKLLILQIDGFQLNITIPVGHLAP